MIGISRYADQGAAGQIYNDEEGDDDVLKSEEKIFAESGEWKLVSGGIG